MGGKQSKGKKAKQIKIKETQTKYFIVKILKVGILCKRKTSKLWIPKSAGNFDMNLLKTIKDQKGPKNFREADLIVYSFTNAGA